MKFLLATIGAGVIATAMLSNPAAARPRCVWEGHHWNCWNSHSWYREGRAWHHGYYGHPGHNMYYGSSGDRYHRDMRYDHRELNYGR